MKTIYDFVTIGIFAALAVVFLHRSTLDKPDRTPIWMYAVAAVGLAFANYLGNEQRPILAAILLVGVMAIIVQIVRPFGQGPSA